MKKALFFLALAAFVVPALAEEEKSWDIYGSVRMHAAYWDRTFWYEKVLDATGNPVGDLNDSVPLQRMIWDLQPNSRFGALGKKGKFGYRFELGWSPVLKEAKITVDNQGGSTVDKKFRNALILRRLYGECYLNDNATLLIGQEWNITNFLNSSQIFEMEAGLGNVGELFTGRSPQVKFSYKDKIGNAMDFCTEFAVVKSDTFTVQLNGLKSTESEEKIPKLEFGGTFNFTQDFFSAKTKIVAGMERYDIITNRLAADTTTHTDKIFANVLGGSAELSVWKFGLKCTYAQGKNLGSYGVWLGDPEGWREAGPSAKNDINMLYPYWGMKDTVGSALPDSLQPSTFKQQLCNASAKGGSLIFLFKPLDWVTLETGGGLAILDHEAFDYWSLKDNKRKPNIFNRLSYYGNCQFRTFDGHLLIIPEYSFTDLGAGMNQSSGLGGKWSAYSLLIQFDI